MMKRTFSLLFLCAMLVAGTMPQLFAQKSTQYKLISYNIRYCAASGEDGDNAWDNRKSASVKMLKQEKPDLFGLQEALPAQLQYIEENFPQYTRIGVGRDDGKQAGECMAVFFLTDKFELLESGTRWLSATPEKVSMGWDAACFRTVTFVHLKDKKTGRDFFYFNTHLDHVGELARKNSVLLLCQLISEMVPEGTPVVLGGDLNSSIESPIFEPFAMNNLLPARNIAPKTDNKDTFNGFGNAPKPCVIDHIFIRDINPIEFQTLTKDYGKPYISDHYPIKLRFEM